MAKRFRFRLKVIGAGRNEVALSGVEIENLAWRMDEEVSDLQSFDIGLYPIVRDEWSEGKSGFKAIQYLAIGIPYVATPVGACAEIGEPGLTHFAAQSGDEWYAALAHLLSDGARRARMGEAARRHSLAHYTLPVQTQKLARALRQAQLT
ncbi:MAG: glycosyltransferase [Pyrinomonadaceae bacterium]